MMLACNRSGFRGFCTLIHSATMTVEPHLDKVAAWKLYRWDEFKEEGELSVEQKLVPMMIFQASVPEVHYRGDAVWRQAELFLREQGGEGLHTHTFSKHVSGTLPATIFPPIMSYAGPFSRLAAVYAAAFRGAPFESQQYISPEKEIKIDPTHNPTKWVARDVDAHVRNLVIERIANVGRASDVKDLNIDPFNVFVQRRVVAFPAYLFKHRWGPTQVVPAVDTDKL